MWDLNSNKKWNVKHTIFRFQFHCESLFSFQLRRNLHTKTLCKMSMVRTLTNQVFISWVHALSVESRPVRNLQSMEILARTRNYIWWAKLELELLLQRTLSNICRSQSNNSSWFRQIPDGAHWLEHLIDLLHYLGHLLVSLCPSVTRYLMVRTGWNTSTEK